MTEHANSTPYTAEVNGAEPGPGPVVMVAGHLAIYDDTAAGNGYALTFRSDDAEPGAEPVQPPIPGFVLPFLVKVLRGEDVSTDDIPGGMGTLAKLRGVLSRG